MAEGINVCCYWMILVLLYSPLLFNMWNLCTLFILMITPSYSLYMYVFCEEGTRQNYLVIELLRQNARKKMLSSTHRLMFGMFGSDQGRPQTFFKGVRNFGKYGLYVVYLFRKLTMEWPYAKSGYFSLLRAVGEKYPDLVIMLCGFKSNCLCSGNCW